MDRPGAVAGQLRREVFDSPDPYGLVQDGVDLGERRVDALQRGAALGGHLELPGPRVVLVAGPRDKAELHQPRRHLAQRRFVEAQLERALIAIKAAKPGSEIHVGDGIFMRFTPRVFSVGML